MREDVEDVYRALGGEPVEVGQDETKPVTKEEFAAKLKAEFDLDVDGGCPRQPAASRAASNACPHVSAHSARPWRRAQPIRCSTRSARI